MDEKLEGVTRRLTDEWITYRMNGDTAPPPLWMFINRLWGKCWCGRDPKEGGPRRIVHCSDRHMMTWFYHAAPYWTRRREQVLNDADYTCAKCGARNKERMDVDHIRAKVLGGDPWDKSNLQALCVTCHKEKTKQDMLEYKRARNGLSTLESFM